MRYIHHQDCSNEFAEIQLRDGRIAKMDLAWDTDDSVQSQNRLDRASRLICDEYRARKTHPPRGGSRRQSAHTWLKRASYMLVSSYLHQGMTQELDQRVKKYGCGARGVKGANNPFRIGLLSIFAHETAKLGPKEIPLLDFRDRERFGSQLLFAYRHFVPTLFLDGFLLQFGAKGIRSLNANNEIEPEFDRWVTDHLTSDECSTDFRDNYPDRIGKAVEAREQLGLNVDQYDAPSDAFDIHDTDDDGWD